MAREKSRAKRRRSLRRTIPMPTAAVLDEEATATRDEIRQLVEPFRTGGVSPALSGGDVDARWDEAESTGDEAAGGSTPTPDQDIVDEIGKAIGVTYQEGEPLRVGGKEQERDEHRWELDPASAEDYAERSRRPPGSK